MLIVSYFTLIVSYYLINWLTFGILHYLSNLPEKFIHQLFFLILGLPYYYNRISIKRTPLVGGKSAPFKEMSALQRFHLKINIQQKFNEELVSVMVFQVDAFHGMTLKRKSLLLSKKKSNFHLISKFEDTMHIWRYEHQKLKMTVCI